MKEYVVRVVETLATTVVVKADTLDDAIDRAHELYTDGEITLDYDNYSDTEFEEAETTLEAAKELMCPVFE